MPKVQGLLIHLIGSHLRMRGIHPRKEQEWRQQAAMQKAKAGGGNAQGDLRDVTPKKPRTPRTGG
ncbi:MAG: hypothetical protein EOP85_21105 [Verrucomicrobiaceae bacterium]|nr:MAG: hypothetical protein EOP85_21105 [Verrucomicrobiaceae bacterium]